MLELGGKSANLIFPDADLDAACAYGVLFSIGNMSGQGCAFPTRMLVHQDVYDEVVERTLAFVAHIKVGDPFDARTTSGPVVNEAALHRILAVIERAQREGAGRLVAGGKRLGGTLAQGYFLEPTMFVDVDPRSHLAQEEVFGPALAITFRDETEAIEIANGTDYGLSAYVQTRDLGRALHFTEELRSGVVLVNGSQNIQPSVRSAGSASVVTAARVARKVSPNSSEPRPWASRCPQLTQHRTRMFLISRDRIFKEGRDLLQDLRHPLSKP